MAETTDAIRFRALLDQSEELVFIVDAESAVLVDVSDATCRISGLDRDHLVGQDARRLHLSYPLQSPEQWRSFVQTAASVGLFLDLELIMREGGTYPARVHVTVREYEGKRYVIAMGRQRAPVEVRNADLERLNVWQTALLSLAMHSSVTEGNLTLALNTIARKAAQALPCHATVVRQREGLSELHWLTDWGMPDNVEHKTFDLRDYPWLEGTLLAGRAIDLMDFDNPEQRAITEEILTGCGAAAGIAAPVRVAGEVRAVVSFYYHRPRKWSREEIAFAAAIADQCAVAYMRAEQHQVEENIRRSEDRYRAFIHHSMEAIWRLEMTPPIPVDLSIEEQVQRILRDGIAAESNDATARMMGLESARQILGRTLTELFQVDDRMLGELRDLVRNGYTMRDAPSRRVDLQEHERWVERSITGVVENGHLARLWGFSRDVTEKARAAGVITNLASWVASNHVEEFFSTLAIHLATSLGAQEVAVTEAAPEPEEDWLDAQQPNRFVAHWKAGAISFMEPAWLASSEDSARVARVLSDSKGRTIGLLAVRFSRPLEDRAAIEFALEAFAARAAAELQRVRYEEKLERSRERYRSFVEFSSDAIWRLDLEVPMPLSLNPEERVEHVYRYGFIAECNETAVRYIGAASRAEVVGSRISATSSDPAYRRDYIRELVTAGDGRLEWEMHRVMPDGSNRWFIRRTMEIQKDSAVIRYWAVSRDITEKRILEQQIRALSARREAVLEQERARISREIHDDLGQQLSALKLQMFNVFENPRTGKPAELLAQIDEAIASTRRIATELRPPILDHFGLAAAVEWHSAEFARTARIACDCDVEEDLGVDRQRSLAVFRVLQESLNNVQRHANATEVMVTLITEGADESTSRELVLRVSDNGIGISRQILGSMHGGLGLVGMRERAVELGGSLTITSPSASNGGVTSNREAGGGTTIELRFPLKDPHPAGGLTNGSANLKGTR